MSGIGALAEKSDGLLRRVDRFLLSLPRVYLEVAILATQGSLLYWDYRSGPWVPFGVFYLLVFYVAVKYVGGRYAYLLAFIVAAGKTYEKALLFPGELPWWQIQWQFVSSYSIFTLFCYLMNSQLGARKRAEDALDELFRLNGAIVAHADSGILVFGGDGKCIVANEAVARMLACSLEQVRGYDLGSDEAWCEQVLLDACRETMRTGSSRKFVLHLGEFTGNDTWCVVSTGRVARADKHYLLLTFADITDYRMAEEARRQADKVAMLALNRASEAEHKLLSISEETQQRIGRELHDDLGQQLTGTAFLTEVLMQKLRSSGGEEYREAEKITLMLNQCISKARHMAHGLCPAELEEQGLCSKLEKFAGHVEGMYQVTCVFHHDENCRIDDHETTIHLFRITQEAVNNAVRHGGATHIILRLSCTPSARELEILDDGCGLPPVSTAPAGGLGLRSMRYRADSIGASMSISARTEGGTQVLISLPIEP